MEGQITLFTPRDLGDLRAIKRKVLGPQGLGRREPWQAQPLDVSGLIRFKPNATVPAGGVLVDANAETSDATTIVLAGRVVSTLGQQPIYLNCGVEIASGAEGYCFRPTAAPVQVAYYATDGTPAAGEAWGPVPYQFTIRKGFPGFKCEAAGDTATGLVWAVVDQSEWLYPILLGAGSLAPDGYASINSYRWDGAAYVYDAESSGNYVYAPFSQGYTIPSGRKLLARWNLVRNHLEAVIGVWTPSGIGGTCLQP